MKSLVKYCTFIIVGYIIIFFNIKYNFNYFKSQCGIGSSIIAEKQSIDISKAILKSTHIIDFFGPSGTLYNIELYLYLYDKNFINRLKFNTGDSNIMLTKRDLYNYYTHFFINFYMEQKSTKKYLLNELSDNWKLSNVKVDQITEALTFNTISMLLTKQYLSEIITPTSTIDIENLKISDYLLTGDMTKQYLNTVVQIINAGDFLKLMERFSNPEFIFEMTKDQEKIKLFDSLYIDKDCVNFINTILGDLIQLYDNKKNEIVLQNNFVLNSFEVKDKAVEVSKFIIEDQNKFNKETLISNVEFSSKYRQIIENINKLNNIFNKYLPFELDLLIEKLQKEGVIMFFVTINDFTNTITEDERLNNWLKNTEQICNYIQKDNIGWVFSCSVLELSKNDMVHSHMIIGLKNLTNVTYNLSKNLTKTIRKMGFIDIKIEFLEKFINCKRVFTYLYKNHNEKYFYNFFNFNIENQQIFSKFLDFIEFEIPCTITGYTVFLHDLNFINKNKDQKKIFDKLLKLNGLLHTKDLNVKEAEVNLITNIYVYYILLNDIKQYNDYYIRKNEKYLVSYDILVKINNLVDIWDDVMLFFLKCLPQYIVEIPLYELKRNAFLWNNLSKKIENVHLLVNIKINVVFTLIEFKDGIYDLKTGNLTHKKNINKVKFENQATLKYTNKCYKYFKIPSTWLINIINKLEYDWDQINELFFHLAIIFSTNYEEIKKKRVLFILGESNTLKTTLIADIFIEFFGIENIALMTQSKNFPFQNFENKIIAILDEFKYYDALHNEYLKLFENRQVLIERKFQDAVSINPLHIVIISNENFIKNQTNTDKQKALTSRVKTFEFIQNSTEITENIKEKIKKENLNIVVFLIKYYNEVLKSNKDLRKKKTTKLLKDVLLQNNNSRLLE